MSHNPGSVDLREALERMPDPTYVKAEIDANPVWALAWRLSEVDNDNAPIRWSQYIPLARWLLDTFELKERRR